MSTALVLTLPEHGHINATLRVVEELVARGEQVRYYATAPYREVIERAGATYLDYGDASAFRPPAHTGGVYSVMAYVARLAERVLPGLVDDLCREPPDYLLIDSMCLWGHLAAQVRPLPAVTLASVFVPNDRYITADEMVRLTYGEAPKKVILDGIAALDEYLSTTQRIDRQCGTACPDIVGFFSGRQALNVLFTSRVFHPAGESYDDSYCFVGPSIEPRAPAPPRTAPSTTDDRPLVYVSMGTIFNDQPRFYRACLDVLRSRPVQAVMAVGSNIDVPMGDVPPNVAVRDFVPQLEILERASLFVTHGGMNSASEALWFGVPLVVFPQHGDQHLVAGRVAELGAGLRITPGDLDPEPLGALLDDVLQNQRYRQGAARVAASFREAGGCHRAADEILSFVASSAPGPGTGR